MKELLQIGLQIGGWSLVALSIGSFWIPKALGWREKLAGLTPLMRELWWTYSIYVWASHVFFAILALGFGNWMMGGSGAAMAMCGFELLWWSVRLWWQFFGFDLREIEGSVFNKIAKHLLTLLFVGLVTLYAGLLGWNAGWLGRRFAVILAIPVLVLAGILAGPLLSKLSPLWLKRFLGWTLLVALVAGAHLSLTNSDPIVRMVGICCVLLGGMKGLVYAEWAGVQKLTLVRYMVFSLLWFGMDPGTFLARRRNLSWVGDVKIGLLLMVAGTFGAWLVWAMEWRQILIVFLPMSLGFHFGALRVLKGGLRCAGYPVRTLFPNALQAQGIGDFWSRRWNVGYSQMMQRLVGRPVEAWAGEKSGVMVIFVVSGVLHEIAITLPVRAGFGLPTLYFTMHGLLTLFEKSRGRPIGKIPALLIVVVPLGILFPTAFQSGVIVRCLGVFDALCAFLEH